MERSLMRCIRERTQVTYTLNCTVRPRYTGEKAKPSPAATAEATPHYAITSQHASLALGQSQVRVESLLLTCAVQITQLCFPSVPVRALFGDTASPRKAPNHISFYYRLTKPSRNHTKRSRRKLTLAAPTVAPLTASQAASLVSSSLVRLPCRRIVWNRRFSPYHRISGRSIPMYGYAIVGVLTLKVVMSKCSTDAGMALWS